MYVYVCGKDTHGDKTKTKIICQEWDLNPRSFEPAPEAGALDRSAILTCFNRQIHAVILHVILEFLRVYITACKLDTYLIFILLPYRKCGSASCATACTPSICTLHIIYREYLWFTQGHGFGALDTHTDFSHLMLRNVE